MTWVGGEEEEKNTSALTKSRKWLLLHSQVH